MAGRLGGAGWGIVMHHLKSHLLGGSGMALALAAVALAASIPGRLALLAGTCLGLLAAALLLRALHHWNLHQDALGLGRLGRRYTRDLILGMGAYVVVLFVSLLLLKRIDAPGLRAMLALLPALPIAWVLRAMIRYVRDSDELQRRIELESISIASASVSMLYMTGGFLQSARVIDITAANAMLWVFPLTCLVYGVAKAVVARRYG